MLKVKPTKRNRYPCQVLVRNLADFIHKFLVLPIFKEEIKVEYGNNQGPNHMQIGVMDGDDESDSSNESYAIDFGYQKR